MVNVAYVTPSARCDSRHVVGTQHRTMKKLEKQSENFRLGAILLRRVPARLPFFTSPSSELRGLPVVVGDDPAELALAADLAIGLRSEVRIEHVVADLFALMRPLRVVMSEPQRHDAVEMLRRE